MSDEPKKRSRASFWRMLVVVFVLYPLSVGPVAWLVVYDQSGSANGVYQVVYWPFNWGSRYCEPLSRVYGTYHWLWTRSETGRKTPFE